MKNSSAYLVKSYYNKAGGGENMKFIKFILVLTLVLSAFSIVQPAEAASTFSDVATDHYAYDAIIWAQQENIVKGYDDGRFRPNANVTEAQFAKMLANYFELQSPDGTLKIFNHKHWADSDYDQLANYAVPLNGYRYDKPRNEEIKRGTVAQAISHLLWFNVNLEYAIEDLLDHGISVGQNESYKDSDIIKYFGAHNSLTRAQVVLFFHRLHLNNYKELSYNSLRFFKDDSYSLNQKVSWAKRFLDESLVIEPPVYIPPVPKIEADSYSEKTKKLLTQLPDWLSYDKNRKEDRYSSLLVYNKFFPKFDRKTINILQKHEAEVDTLTALTLSFATKNNGGFGVSVYTDPVNKGNYFYITYDTFTNDEIVHIIKIVSGLNIPVADLNKAKNGVDYYYQANGRYFNIWGREDGVLFITEKAEKFFVGL